MGSRGPSEEAAADGARVSSSVGRACDHTETSVSSPATWEWRDGHGIRDRTDRLSSWHAYEASPSPGTQ